MTNLNPLLQVFTSSESSHQEQGINSSIDLPGLLLNQIKDLGFNRNRRLSEASYSDVKVCAYLADHRIKYFSA